MYTLFIKTLRNTKQHNTTQQTSNPGGNIWQTTCTCTCTSKHNTNQDKAKKIKSYTQDTCKRQEKTYNSNSQGSNLIVTLGGTWTHDLHCFRLKLYQLSYMYMYLDGSVGWVCTCVCMYVYWHHWHIWAYSVMQCHTYSSLTIFSWWDPRFLHGYILSGVISSVWRVVWSSTIHVSVDEVAWVLTQPAPLLPKSAWRGRSQYGVRFTRYPHVSTPCCGCSHHSKVRLCLLFYVSSVVVVEGLEVRLYRGASGRVISLVVGRETNYFLWQRASMLVDKPATGNEVEKEKE